MSGELDFILERNRMRRRVERRKKEIMESYDKMSEAFNKMANQMEKQKIFLEKLAAESNENLEAFRQKIFDEIKDLTLLASNLENQLLNNELEKHMDKIKKSMSRIEIIDSIVDSKNLIESFLEEEKVKLENSKKESSLISNENLSDDEIAKFYVMDKLREIGEDPIYDDVTGEIIVAKGERKIIGKVDGNSLVMDFFGYEGKKCIKDMAEFQSLVEEDLKLKGRRWHTPEEDGKLKKKIATVYESQIIKESNKSQLKELKK